jgi:tetratricopeptide (TPR) repeat protein
LNLDELINESDIIRLQGRFEDALKYLDQDGSKFDNSFIKAQRALILCEKGDFDESYDLLKSLEKKIVNDETIKFLAVVYHGLGRFYELKQLFHHDGDYHKAHDYFRKSLNLKEQLDDKRGITELLFRVGVIYERIGGSDNDEKAIEFYKKSVKVGEEFNQEIASTSTLTHLAGQYEKKGDIKNAFEMYKKNLSISEKLERGTGIAWCYVHLGRNLSKLEPDIERAIFHYKKSIEKAESINFIRSPPVALYYWARIYLEAQKYDSALEKFREALDYGLKTDNKYVIYPSYSALILTLTRLVDYQQTLITLEEFLNLLRSDSQFKEQGLSWSDELGKIYLSLGLWLSKSEIFPLKDDILQILKEFNLEENPEACFRTAIEFSDERSDYYTSVPALYELGKLLYESGNKNDGIVNIERALAISEQYHLIQEKIYIKNLLESLN